MAVYQDLRSLIVNGDVDASTKVSEASLAEMLSVSRTPVREALHRLEGDGLVLTQGRGVRVRVQTTAELVHVFEARAALDGCVAALVATRSARGELAPARVVELRRLASETDDLTRRGDIAAATVRNREFHERIAFLAGNPVICATLAQYWDQITISTRRGLDGPSRKMIVNREHEHILDAISAGDPERASREATNHALTTRTLALDNGGRQ